MQSSFGPYAEQCRTFSEDYYNSYGNVCHRTIANSDGDGDGNIGHGGIRLDVLISMAMM